MLAGVCRNTRLRVAMFRYGTRIISLNDRTEREYESDFRRAPVIHAGNLLLRNFTFQVLDCATNRLDACELNDNSINNLMTEQIQGELVMRLTTLNTKIQKRLGGAFSSHGISFTEYLVLFNLEGTPNNTMRRVDLAERVGLSASGVTRLLNPMGKTGLIRKEENARDARVSLVALSDAGRRVFQEASVSFSHAAEELFDSLEKKKQRELFDLITDLL